MHIIKITRISFEKKFVKMKLYSLDVNKVSRRECFTNSLRNFYGQIQKGRLREFLRKRSVRKPKQTLYFS